MWENDDVTQPHVELILGIFGFGKTQIPYDMFSLKRNADEAKRFTKCANIYHKGQELAWDGREVLQMLIEQHNGIRIEPDKRQALERLFAMGPEGESGLARRRRLASRRSILDFVREDAGRVQTKLGRDDRHRMDEYLEGVRALERRVEMVARATDDPSEVAGFEVPRGVPGDYAEHVRLMNELLVLALRLDRTRIATFMLANEGSNRPYPFLEVREGHHHLSHHGGDESKVEQVRRINRFQSEMLADLLQRMDAVEGGGDAGLGAVRSLVALPSARQRRVTGEPSTRSRRAAPAASGRPSGRVSTRGCVSVAVKSALPQPIAAVAAVCPTATCRTTQPSGSASPAPNSWRTARSCPGPRAWTGSTG